MRTTACTLVLFAAPLVCAQTFEVASAKLASEPPRAPNQNFHVIELPRSGGPGSSDPTRLRFPYSMTMTLLCYAYSVQSFQVSGPDWLQSEHYALDARVRANATQEQAALMMQHLLAARFHLTVRRETWQGATFTRTVAKSGPKLRVASPAGAANRAPAPPPPVAIDPKLDSAGFPDRPMPAPGTMSAMGMPGRNRIYASAVPISDLVASLIRPVHSPITDATGLTGKYDFIFTYSNEGLGNRLAPTLDPANRDNVYIPSGDRPQDLFGALRAQLGLRLEAKKGPAAESIVDHADKVPTEN